MPMPTTTAIVTWTTINVVSMTFALFTGYFTLDFNRLTKKHLLWLNLNHLYSYMDYWQ